MTDHSHHQHHAGCSHGADTKTATDPVCGMKVDPHTTPHHTTHDGEDHLAGVVATLLTLPLLTRELLARCAERLLLTEAGSLALRLAPAALALRLAPALRL